MDNFVEHWRDNDDGVLTVGLASLMSEFHPFQHRFTYDCYGLAYLGATPVPQGVIGFDEILNPTLSIFLLLKNFLSKQAIKLK